jgi:hypothetical protein
MKIKDIKSRIIRKSLRITARNIKLRKKIIRLQKGTEEQIELAKICIILDKRSLKFSTRYERSIIY